MRSLRASIIAAALGVGDGEDLGRPRARQSRDDGADPVPDPGIDDRGQVAGPGQFPLVDRGGQDLADVQADQLRGPHGPPQPSGLVAGLSPVLRRSPGAASVP